jgi:hypothetical protein
VRKTGFRLQTSGVRKRDKSLFKKELGEVKIFLFFLDFVENTMRVSFDVEKNYQEFTTEITEHTEKKQDIFATDSHRFTRLRVFHAEARRTRRRICFKAGLRKPCKFKTPRRAPNAVCPLPQHFEFWLLCNNALKQKEKKDWMRIDSILDTRLRGHKFWIADFGLGRGIQEHKKSSSQEFRKEDFLKQISVD